MKKNLFLLAALAPLAVFADDFDCTRVFREPRYARGNTNVLKLQPIDDASWLWMPGDSGTTETSDAWGAHPEANANAGVKFLKFRCEFTAAGDAPLTLDVSADERFYLTLDGRFIARGPNRSTVENWQYQTYRLDKLAPGKHTLEAVVWKTGDHGPLAQLSHRGGFVLKADGAYDAQLTTGKGEWRVGWLSGIRPDGTDNGVWGTGSQFEITGRGPYAGEPKKYVKAAVVRGGAGRKGPQQWGGRTGGWMLFPTQLPDQTEYVVTPGAIRAATTEAAWRGEHVYTESETKSAWVKAFNDLLSSGKAVTIPPKTRLQLAWDLGRYICAYPELATAHGAGSRVSWGWTESTRDAGTKRKNQRDAIVGKFVQGYGDTFLPDGKPGLFSAPWFRCGRWCRLDIETKDAPLTISALRLIESRYPVELESVFTSPQDDSLQGIRRICARAMQMCDHEMLFDCPYYEQQMYPGDTRVQLLVLSAMARDDRMIRRAIEIYDLATRDDGMCPMNFPTRGLQESLSYTLCYLCMYGDYVMNHANRDWLKARLPGMRKSMAGVEYYENADGLIANPPGWNFMDWVVGWETGGTVPGTYEGEGVTSELNLFWLLAMQSAARVERVLGHELQAQYWEKKAAALKEKIVATFWVEGRGLLADNPKKDTFSEHSQSLAILADALPADKARTAFAHLIADPDLKRCTVYFSYYLFEAYFKMGRADLFQKRLDLWRDYVKLGVTTLLEQPETKDRESRSDCHAWGAHPIWFMQTGLAGIRSDAPFFRKVRVAPCPGSLKEIHATHPHPDGWIKADLTFDGGKASGTVETPVPGVFVYGGCTVELKAGRNEIR